VSDQPNWADYRDPHQPGLWRVVGLIAAIELPTEPTDAGDCIITPLPAPRWTPQRRRGLTVQPNPSVMAAPFTVVEPELRFYAHHAITTEVQGTRDEAVAIARRRFEQTVGILAVASDPRQPPPLFQIVGAIPIEPGIPEGEVVPFEPASSVQMIFGPMIVNPMSPPTKGRFAAIRELVVNDERVANIVRLWGAAEHEYREMFSEADRDACMVHYVKVIEQIAQAFNPLVDEVDPAAQAELIADLAVALADDQRTAEQKIAALDDATRQLNRLRDRGSRAQLKRTTKKLGTPDFATKAILDSWDLRSSRAAHPNPATVTEDEVNTARLAASELMILYFNHRWGQSATTDVAGDP